MDEPRLPKSLRDLVQVRLTYNRKTGELLVRGLPRDEDMIRFVISAAAKAMRDRTARTFLSRPMAKN